MQTVQFHGLKPVAPLGLGTWQWGDQLFWGYGKGYADADLEASYRAALAGGVQLLDTAEVYGFGKSEQLLARFRRPTDDILTVSKCFPFPWRYSRKTLIGALKASLKRLELPRLDLYLMHWPWRPVSVEGWAESMAEAYELGLTKAVGVSNYSLEQMERAAKVLARHNLKLAANQVEYHLLNRKPEASGLLRAMKAEGIVLMAYSPLGMGWLTGKYSLDNPPPGRYRGQRYAASRARIPGVLAALDEVAKAHAATPAQVALRWCIEKGTLPIPGAKNARQAESNAGALRLALTADEVARLDAASG